MDMMKEAIKRRMNQGLDVKISVMPAQESKGEMEENQKTSDLAPNPMNEDEGDAVHSMGGKQMSDEDMKFEQGEEKGPSLFARAIRGMKKGK